MNEYTWHGWFNPFSGYGKANLEWSCALNRVSNGRVYLGWGKRKREDDPEVWDNMSEEHKALHTKESKKTRIGIIKTTPDLFYNNTNEFKVGFSMVENTKIGPEWVKHCNSMDHIFVPNKMLIEVFSRCGVVKPISQVRQGFNPKNYPYFQRVKKDSFTFSLAGWLDERKNWDDVVRAFMSEFDSGENVRLILKNTNPQFGYHIPKDNRIKIVDRLFSEAEMTRFYQITDCFMFTSRGEGSGLPAREAMATGCPIIVTNWSGLAEVADSSFNYPIDPISIDYPDNRKEQPGFMARMDVAEIMYWMRHVYENQEEAFEKGKLASKVMHESWTWDACAREMLAILDTL